MYSKIQRIGTSCDWDAEGKSLRGELIDVPRPYTFKLGDLEYFICKVGNRWMVYSMMSALYIKLKGFKTLKEAKEKAPELIAEHDIHSLLVTDLQTASGNLREDGKATSQYLEYLDK